MPISRAADRFMLSRRPRSAVLDSALFVRRRFDPVSRVTPSNRRACALPRQTWAASVLVVCCLHASAGLAQNEAVPAFKSVDSMEARVQGCVTCHGQSGQGTGNGAFPAHRRQAGGLPLQPAGRVSGRDAAVPADELPRRVPAGRVSARDGRVLRKAAPAVRGEGCDARRRRSRWRAARRHRDRGRREQGHSGVHRLPRRRPDRHGARHSRARRAAVRTTSPPSSRAGASATGTRPSPTA